MDLLRHPNPAELAEDAASRLAEDLSKQASDSKRSVIRLALPGGRIARRFLEALLQRCPDTTLTRVHFFWADERCVPPDHADSNFRIAAETLLASGRVAASNVHRIQGEQPPATAAHLANLDLQQHLITAGSSGSQHTPILDAVVLGMGEDGHVASLFPHEPEATLDDPDWFRPVIAAKPPPERITMGYRLLASARLLVILASGPGKSDALHASLAPDGTTPLARLLRLRLRLQPHQAISRIHTDNDASTTKPQTK